eukprot:scaffold5089_cov156-Amphora_coffeaeformis.AAC.4
MRLISQDPAHESRKSVVARAEVTKAVPRARSAGAEKDNKSENCLKFAVLLERLLLSALWFVRTFERRSN